LDMPSIKHSSYRLPIIEPIRVSKSFMHSANKPLLITGVDIETGEKDDFVVKLIKAERMSASAFQRELLAAFMAMEMDLPVTVPAIINITSDFVELLRGQSEYAVASQSLGYNFGTRYVDRYQVLAIHQKLPETLLERAAEILAFDVLIQNADRTLEPPGKPNLLTNGKELLMFDHELAFEFTLGLSSLRSKAPWIIRDSDKLWIEKHCLFRTLKNYTFDEQNLLDKFARLDGIFWSSAWERTPNAWKDKEQFEVIKDHINQIVSNKALFFKNLQLLLL
jgi:hypothetical protein